MKRYAFGLALLVALLVTPVGGAGNVTITVQHGGFTPRTVSIQVGDTVTWQNAGQNPHQIIADDGSFVSPILKPGESWPFSFNQAGDYGFGDRYSRYKGVVHVAEPPAAVDLAASATQVKFGQTVTLSGQISNRRAGEQVELSYWGLDGPATSVMVATAADGVFSYRLKPRLLTSFVARWHGASSATSTVQVAPVVTLGRHNGWVTRVYAARPMVGRVVQIQRFSSFGQWVTIKKVHLGASSRAHFRLQLRRGLSYLRVAMSVNQAGPGYLAGFSRVVAWRVP